MSKYSRYLFTKKMYPDYLVFILKDNKLITYDQDLEIVEYLGLENILKNNINYLILDNLDLRIYEYFDNYYFYYYKIIFVKRVIDLIKKSIMKVCIKDLLDIYDLEIRKNCRNKRKIYYFEKNKMENITSIYNSLVNNTYSPDKYNIFIIRDPKYRIVMSNVFKYK